ncbi:RNA polymerase II degradation factor 1-like isoform X2 [Athalia rosae]|uniref:RNA polymerase II degradation factor 1-like isoform X1 n=1 Tax=Athalia rosae TaxID=37344 RepID=UPI002033E553|nr:RNA polymerase II degradation factor 1-like isoform X1 [Athalia rosae]XP_048504701.1 RNA polymerase II degradation factor 1-like isoform X2 [Athalia rosae]
MKFYALLAVLCCAAAAVADKKINLEDIERDNLQSEAHSEEERAPGPEEQKYNSDKADGNANPQYQAEARVIGGQRPQDIKYVAEPQEYSDGLDAYQQQQHQQAAQQAQLTQQYYTPSYQAESQVSYQPQLQVQALNYQSALPVANHIQNYEQQSATEKFIQGSAKGNHYANIGGTQQLLYYPTQSVAASSKSQIQPLLHRLASQAAQNVQLESYDQSLDQSAKLAYQQQPQIQYVYEPQYVQQAVAPAPAAKDAQKYAYVTLPQSYSTQQAYSGQTYTQQPNSEYNQPKQAYTQAYFVQPQSAQLSHNQYYQLPAYTSGSGHRSNSHGYAQSQPLYVSSDIAQQLASQIYRQQGSHSIAQNYAKIPQEPRFALAPPQLSAQKFRNGPVTFLRPVHSGVSNNNNNPIVYPSYSSGPKSLLDSYTPSLVIAAQDSERYRERPLQLESGFLPSKGAYAHSYNQKRQSD